MMLRRLYRSIARAVPIPGIATLGKLPSPLIYLIAVVATKGMSLVTLPIMAAYLPPEEYGNYDVAVSFIEFINLILGLAIGATLIRFASTATDEESARQCARELIGTALCLAIIFGTPVIIAGPYILDALGITMHHNAMRVLIGSVTVAAMIELPLFWLRLKDRAIIFFAVVMVRTIAQVILIWLALSYGYGVPGVMVANGGVILAVAATLLFMQIRDTGIAVSNRALMQVVVYGLPIVGADLAMFGLGNANRLFMPDHVPPEVIAHFGLAMRLALIISLATSPFDLWWTPKRIAMLTKPGGLERSAQMWSIGFAIIALAATAVALGGPLIVHILLPAAYGGTNAFITPLVVIQAMHIVTIFTNVGSYARANGAVVFGIEATSAAVAITGYLTLIPMFGANGVMAAMALGQVVRFCLHLWFGRELAPLPYPWVPALITVVAAVALVALAPPHEWLVWRFLYSGFALALLAAVIVASGLIKPPEDWKDRILSRIYP